jgi:hypothetical protein
MALRMSQMLRFSRDVPKSAPVTAVVARNPSEDYLRAPAAASPQIQPATPPPLPMADFGNLIEAAGLPSSAVAEDATEPAVEVYEQLLSAVQLIFDAAANGGAPDGSATVAPVRAVREQLEQGDALLAVTVRHRGEADSLAKRSANVAILSMRLGMEVNYDERRCVALGLCGLMHDIGMLTIPDEAMKARKFGQEQRKLLHLHPMESKTMVQSFGEAFHWVGKIAVQVHERWDGGGYPEGLEGGRRFTNSPASSASSTPTKPWCNPGPTGRRGWCTTPSRRSSTSAIPSSSPG